MKRPDDKFREIEVLKTTKEVQTQRSTRRTAYEGVPISVNSSELDKQE